MLVAKSTLCLVKNKNEHLGKMADTSYKTNFWKKATRVEIMAEIFPV